MKKSVGLFSAFGIAISLVLSGLTPSAQAVQVTITFDGALNSDGSYTENGMTVTPGLGTLLLFGDADGDLSTDLINTGPGLFGPIYTFNFFGGESFDVLFVDIVDGGSAVFTPSSGMNTLAGSLIAQDMFGDPGGLNGPGWLNITSFTWQMGPCAENQQPCSSAIDNLKIDDLGLTPIPEPSTLLLFGSGFVAMGATVRRRSRRFNPPG